MLDLSDDQRQELVAIQQDQIQQQWDLMQQMRERTAALQKLYQAEQPDAQAIGKAHDRVFEVRRKMIENRIEAQNRMSALLTDEQREAMRNMQGGGMPAN
ncbi:Spy/CpxP family protein refolding chaperone [Modicisalibacter ilicicola]